MEMNVRLIGTMASPYVRRVAVSLNIMGLPFAHEPVSVFRDFDRFASLNPVVKAPTLITDDGVALMDSTLILDYVERLAPEHARLAPPDLKSYPRAQRIVGLGLAACEKTVQIVYERNHRPSAKVHEPWVERVTTQLHAAYGLLEAELQSADTPWIFGPKPLQADITAAVAWRFTRHVLAEDLSPDLYPALSALSQRAEERPEFASAPIA
jgi:glutathione S-transferase